MRRPRVWRERPREADSGRGRNAYDAKRAAVAAGEDTRQDAEGVGCETPEPDPILILLLLPGRAAGRRAAADQRRRFRVG